MMPWELNEKTADEEFDMGQDDRANGLPPKYDRMWYLLGYNSVVDK